MKPKQALRLALVIVLAPVALAFAALAIAGFAVEWLAGKFRWCCVVPLVTLAVLCGWDPDKAKKEPK